MGKERSSVYDRFREGVLEGLADRELALDPARKALDDHAVDLADTAREHQRAQQLADFACRHWLPEVLRECEANGNFADAVEHQLPITDAASAATVAGAIAAFHGLLETEPAKTAAHLSWQAAGAVAADDSDLDDRDQTAAHTAGRVLAELWIIVDDQQARDAIAIAGADLAERR